MGRHVPPRLGTCHEGEWRTDTRHGKGKFTFVNGDEYEG